MPMLTPTEKNQIDVGLAQEDLVSVLIMVCWSVWRIRRSRKKPKPGHVEGFLTLEGTRGQILCQVAIKKKSATRRTKEEHHYGSPELVRCPGQRCQQT